MSLPFLSMEENLCGKIGEKETFQKESASSSSSCIGLKQAVNIITNYTDAIPTGERLET